MISAVDLTSYRALINRRKSMNEGARTDEDILSLQSTLPYGLSDISLVTIKLGRVNVSAMAKSGKSGSI
jgi:hypothetical protein